MKRSTDQYPHHSSGITMNNTGEAIHSRLCEQDNELRNSPIQWIQNLKQKKTNNSVGVTGYYNNCNFYQSLCLFFIAYTATIQVTEAFTSNNNPLRTFKSTQGPIAFFSSTDSTTSNNIVKQSYHPQQQQLLPKGGALRRPYCYSSTSTYNTHLFSTNIQRDFSTSRRGPKPDESEWTSLVAAFQMYKAAYGDLKVPSRFVVPAMVPWPEAAWGLKLGQRVAAIRSTGKYVEDDKERRKVLDDLGFLWRLRAPSPDKNMDVSFDQIYDALVTYRNEIQPEGSLNVPSNFIVPTYDPWPESCRGMPLGKKIPTVRSKAYLKANPGALEKLNKIGFEFDGKVAANDQRFQLVYDALIKYKEINNDLLVPQPFVVPEQSDEWPEETWGLRLGARVNAIRSQGTFVNGNPSRKEMLDQLGFEWELPSSTGKKRGRKKKNESEALSGPAPPGILTSSLDGDDDNYDDDEDMNEEEENFNSDPTSGSFGSSSPFDDNYFFEENKTPKWVFQDEQKRQELSMQQQQQQNIEDDIIPEKNLNVTLEEAAARARAVGVIESLGQGKRVVKGKINKFIPWFNDDFGEDFVFEDVVEALTIYKQIHGSFEGVDYKDFVVPEPSFGDSIDIEASARAAAAIAEAEAKGEDSFSLIAAEIERMESNLNFMDDDMDIDKFDDDEDDDDEEEDNEQERSKQQWPEHLAGLKLGTIVKRIRDGSLEVGHIPERRAQLDAIGFDWGNKKQFLDVAFEKAMCAMFAYFLVRGDLFVYEDFVMPDDNPWPSALAGYELGKSVKRIRELQNFFEAYHPEKVELLRRVEFVWFPELALPLNPEDGEESWEDLYVEGVGHPFFQLNEPTVSMLDTLQSEGPWGPEGATKSWYDYKVVSEYWEKGDVIDAGKYSERPNWRAAQWLWFNGFNQLSREHEERYGVDHGLEMIRLIEQYHEGAITENEFDARAADAILGWEREQLRNEARAAGFEVGDDDDIETMIQKVKETPEFLALDDDPEYQSLIQAQMEADEEEYLLRMEAEGDDEYRDVEEEDIEEDDDDDYEYVYEEDDDDESESSRDDDDYAVGFGNVSDDEEEDDY